MDPFTIAALVSAGASLIGGNRNRKAQSKANRENAAANTPEAQVAAWEKAGINPIMGVTQGQFIPQNNRAVSMGDAFANAGSALAQGLTLNHEQNLRETEVQQENETLKKALSESYKPLQSRSNMDQIGIDPSTRSSSPAVMTQGPKQPLIPKNSQGFGGSSSIAPERDVKIDPYSVMPGAFAVNNRATFGDIIIPGDDGEVLSIGDWPTVLAFGVPQVALNVFEKYSHKLDFSKDGSYAGSPEEAAARLDRDGIEKYQRDRFIFENPFTGGIGPIGPLN